MEFGEVVGLGPRNNQFVFWRWSGSRS